MIDDVKILYCKTHFQYLVQWLAILDDVVVGHIFALLEPDNKIKFLDAWVHEDYRRKGIYRKLWDTRWSHIQENYKGHIAYAWCKPMSLPLFLEKEFDKDETCVYVEKNIK